MADKKYIPKSIDNALHNLTDKPTEEIGNGLANLFNLILGKVNFISSKNKIEYAYNLKLFEKELFEKINDIPDDELIKPQTRIVTKALDSAKYSLEDEDIRKLFTNLISRSMTNKTKSLSYPIYIEIINQLSPLDARLFKYIYNYTINLVTIDDFHKYLLEDEMSIDLSVNFSILESLGLIRAKFNGSMTTLKQITKTGEDSYFYKDVSEIINQYLYRENKPSGIFDGIALTTLGIGFAKVCL